VRSGAGPAIVASVISGGPRDRVSPAQQAVTAALDGMSAHAGALRSPGENQAGQPCGRCIGNGVPGEPALSMPVFDAARRFAALPAAARHAWLMRHWTALRAGRLTLAQLP
jgi:hypothetical protein